MESNKQVTAVEWLELQMDNLLMDGCAFDSTQAIELYKQAKEMEKQQIIVAYNDGCIHTLKDKMRKGEQYYNETFNK